MGSEGTKGHRVLIAGGGIAALETALALRDLAGDRVRIDLLAPERYLTYRPLPVADALALRRPSRFDLEAITRGAGIAHVFDRLATVDPACRAALTRNGRALGYDTLVLATGARARATIEGATTYSGTEDARAIRALLRAADTEAVRSVVFAIPAGAGWPLPAYELALLAASRHAHNGGGVRVTVATHEGVPLTRFGARASARMAVLLHERCVQLSMGRQPAKLVDGGLQLAPSGYLEADRVVALPAHEGRPLAGIPSDEDGFIATDANGRVSEVQDVYAAGDATAFPVKHGVLASQQAHAVAASVAAEAGAPIARRPFEPTLSELVLRPRTDRVPGPYLSARLVPPRPRAAPRPSTRSGRFSRHGAYARGSRHLSAR